MDPTLHINFLFAQLNNKWKCSSQFLTPYSTLLYNCVYDGTAITGGISGNTFTGIIIIIVVRFGLIASGTSVLPVMSHSVRFWQGIFFFVLSHRLIP